MRGDTLLALLGVAAGFVAVAFRRSLARDAMEFQDRVAGAQGKYANPGSIKRAEWVYLLMGGFIIALCLWDLTR